MLVSRLMKYHLAAIVLVFCSHAIAADVGKNKKTGKDDDASKSEEVKVPVEKQAPSKAEKFAEKFSLGGGFGWISAYRTKRTGTLGANGMADVKLSYELGSLLFQKQIYLTARYLPFNISPTSDVNNVVQEYSGTASAYAVGSELAFYNTKNMDLLVSLEVGAYKATLSELIPVHETNPPIKKYGALFIGGVELRHKVMEKFSLGPRLYFAGGNITFISFLVGGTFYF